MPGPDDTDVQRAFWKGLTDQRAANIWEMADLIGDMNNDGIEFLRSMGGKDHRPLQKFLLEAKDETFTFLTDLRSDELKELSNAIENARAFRRGGRLLRWGIVTLFGTFVGITIIWDKVSAFLKGGK